MTWKWIFVVLAAAAVFGTGCEGRQRTIDTSSGAPRELEAKTTLVAKSRPPIPDVPVPIGFKLDEGKSRSYSAAGARYIEHLYKGGDDKFVVGEFYRRQMPIAKWALVTDMFVQGYLMLDFEKETERCSVTISDGGLFTRTNVRVDLRTIGRIPSSKYNK